VQAVKHVFAMHNFVEVISDASSLFWHPAPSVTEAQCHPAGSESNRFVETDFLSKSIHINHIK
jgi:hypothetical protein